MWERVTGWKFAYYKSVRCRSHWTSSGTGLTSLNMRLYGAGSKGGVLGKD